MQELHILCNRANSNLLMLFFFLTVDPTRIIAPPQDAQIISGTTAQLICRAEYDKSLQGSFEVMWRKDGEDLPVFFEENSRWVALFS